MVADGRTVNKGKILLQRNAGDGDPILGEASIFLIMISRWKLWNCTIISTGIPFKKVYLWCTALKLSSPKGGQGAFEV